MVTVKELQAELRKRGLQTTGLKAELVQRLAEASANETKKEGTADGTPRKKSKTQSKRKSSTANSKGASKRRKKELAGYGTIPPHITPDELCHPNTTRNFADLLVRMKVRRIPRDVLTWAIDQTTANRNCFACDWPLRDTAPVRRRGASLLTSRRVL